MLPKWFYSCTVWGSAIVAAIAGLAQAGFVSPQFASNAAGLIAAVTGLMRFRPSAGKSITDLQSDRPN